MSLPVSQYEALLAEVRGLRRKVQRVQQLADPLISEARNSNSLPHLTGNHHQILNDGLNYPLDYTMESLMLDRQNTASRSSNDYDGAVTSSAEGDTTGSEDEYRGVRGTHMSVSSEPISHNNRNMSGLYHGTWPVEKNMWNSEPIVLEQCGATTHLNNLQDVNSVMSFASSAGGVPLDRVLGSPDRSRRSSQQLEAKVDMVYSLLAMLGSQEHADMGETLLALSTNPESCLAMRQSGCIPLLVQLVQSDRDSDTRRKAAQALHNLVHSQTDEKIRKREVRIFRLLEHTRAYTEALKNNLEFEPDASSSDGDSDKHPVQTVAHLMKLSFDEGHRQAICQLGGIHTIASLVEAEHANHGSTTNESQCIILRRYACMALTNLTFGDSGNKALLCSYREFMRALVVQLQSPSDELRQVTASVLRNLSWRADSTSKEILREVGSVTGLMKAAMMDNKENTLKSILSALWNLSAHCTENKSEICAVEGALAFLVQMLIYKTPSKSLAIIENSGGILRNISSQIAVREDYREMLRKHNCLQILLDQLKSPSLTIVSNACGTLWNLSAKCAVDQEALCRMGAPAMLRSLNYSKHKMIAMGSTAALKNLVSAKPTQALGTLIDPTSATLDLPALPTLGARKQKNLLQDLDQNLSETYENIEKESPVKQPSLTNDFLQKPHKYSRKSEHKDYIRNSIDSQEDLSNTFSSLNLNEPSTSYSPDIRTHSRLQNYGSASLPYMNLNQKRSTTPSTYIPVRNKFSDYDDETEPSDQPIDYSRKYAENKMPSDVAKCSQSSTIEHENMYVYKGNESSEESYGIYAETDLDQPTDYSLRYAEGDSDSDICSKLPKNEPEPEFIQDTVKTYCTEDTPYETPFNFSTATSMSDLRIDDKDDKPIIDNDKQMQSNPTSKELTAHLDEKDHCSTEDISDIESRSKCEDKKIKSAFSSGMMTPEKPVNYCEEGTPALYSRVSSLSSLNSIPVGDNTKKESSKNLNYSMESEPSDREKVTQKSTPETKAVKFEQVVNYAEQTPLMFSRSSSLGSLGSAEQNSFDGDMSSVVSDFSRLTSGIISPSELPDSPFHTVPQSPKPKNAPMEFPTSSKSSSNMVQQQSSKCQQKASVFDDDVTKFKEESTPIQFSNATSLSNLTIDDEINPQVQVSEDEGDEDILAACINSGMQNNRYCQKNQNSLTPAAAPPVSSKLPVPNFKYQKNPNQGASSSIPVPRSSPRSIPPPQPPPNISRTKIHPNGDTLTTYCTEDTPAVMSHAGSNSDLSVLSITDSDVKPRSDCLSDDSNMSEDNDNLLAQCIQSAMPKPKNDSIVSNQQVCVSIASKDPTKCNRRSLLSEASKEEMSVLNNKSVNPILPGGSQSSHHRGGGVVDCSSGSIGFDDDCSARNVQSNQFVDGGNARSDYNSDTEKRDGPFSALRQKTQSSDVLNISEENNSARNDHSHNDSYSSLESTGVSEADLALLEQCISLGMQKSKKTGSLKSVDLSEADQTLLEQCITSAMPKSKHHSSDVNETKPKRFTDTTSLTDSTDKPKNVNVASATGNTIRTSSNVRPEITATVVGVEENPRVEMQSNPQSEKPGTQQDTLQDKCLHSEENLLTDLMKSGSNKSLGKILDESVEISSTDYSYSISDNCNNFVAKDDICLVRSCESAQIVDNRMLDPDAMIESLDRFTAELVSQASHLNKDDKFRTSGTDNTWNEDTSPNEITFPSISGSAPNVITFPSETDESSGGNKLPADEPDGFDNLNPEQPEYSNDFSSVNTSTMTESTLIAIEASKMATVFQNEAAMSLSVTSATSLELDQIQPPSQLNSLTSSLVGNERSGKESLLRSPKLIRRKKSLPQGLMVRRALSNSLNHSLESLENNSLSNLDQVHPPSAMGDILDLENSMCSITSLPYETADMKTDFIINGVLTKDTAQTTPHNPIFNVKQPANMFHLLGNSNLNSLSDLDHMNPPSLFNEITDLCNSLADVATENICSETEIFEDCCTHLGDNTLMGDATLKTEDDGTEFSDANSITPIQSDMGSSSNESTPKKTKSISKQMTSKQKRALAKERYKTYTVAAEMLMKEEISNQIEDQTETHTITEDFRTANNSSQDYKTIENTSDDVTYVSPTYSIKEERSGKLTPRERRQIDRFRFQTQVLDESITSGLKPPAVDVPNNNNIENENSSSKNETPESSPMQSPARSKLSIRRSFIQKRMENKDRFKTQTLDGSSFSPESSSASSTPPVFQGEADLQLHLQKEANLVLKSLRETKMKDELLDCETLSLVSNDDDSENNSVSSLNYRTYHKSWGFRRNNMPVAPSVPSDVKQNGNIDNPSTVDLTSVEATEEHSDNSQSEDEEQKPGGKPKIVKPTEKPEVDNDTQNEESVVKTVRGRRKPLYNKTPTTNNRMKPIKTLTSNLVKNVTSTIKTGATLKSVVNRQNRNVTTKPPVPQNRTSSGYGSKSVSNSSSPKTSPARRIIPQSSPKRTVANNASSKSSTPSNSSPLLERQGTFTKDDPKPASKSKIPTSGISSKIPTSKIPKSSSVPSKIPAKSGIPSNINKLPVKSVPVKSASSDRATKGLRVYNRSTSADSRETAIRKIQNSSSSQSLKSETGKSQPNSCTKKPVSQTATRSSSNTSLNSNGSSTSKKQVTSKIASLWKKIEESKKQPPKNDTRVWIQPEQIAELPPLIRSNTFDNKEEVTMRTRSSQEGEAPKRLSRLGSFIIMDEAEDTLRIQVVDS